MLLSTAQEAAARPQSGRAAEGVTPNIQPTVEGKSTHGWAISTARRWNFGKERAKMKARNAETIRKYPTIRSFL
ncbi:MAG TPA: hypothetical protein H9797_00090 [Candidatus Gallimonas gallistercoris]|uniref:Uncharacterized protein n=1 Tax=Candidatus Gallimonas gallistercoris TaxID=2838602 RepID=A0A9D2H113_9FIRM|nr:hypothetical protein [Candidatus Gallimonas gallistercoris]